MKILLSTLLLSTLVACGEEDDIIVYEETPIELPSEYTLSESDKAPVFFGDVFAYIEGNVVEPAEATQVPDGVELTDEQTKALEEELKLVEASNELLQKELDAENSKLGSIRLVSVKDPTEANDLLLADALLEYEAYVLENTPEYVFPLDVEGEETEEQLSNDDDEVSLEPTVDTTPTTPEPELIDEVSFLQEVELDSYLYTYDISTTGYTGGQATSGYVSLLSSSGFKIIDPFHPVDDEYYEMLTPDFTQRAGTVAMAKKASGTERLMLIIVDWNYYGATVSVEYRDGTLWIAPDPPSAASKGSLSIADAVGFLESRSPSELGLTGGAMTDYNVYTAEGVVLINGVSYRQFNISQKATNGNGNTYAGSYLINGDGDTYRIDQTTGAVYPLNITNVFDTMG